MQKIPHWGTELILAPGGGFGLRAGVLGAWGAGNPLGFRAGLLGLAGMNLFPDPPVQPQVLPDIELPTLRMLQTTFLATPAGRIALAENIAQMQYTARLMAEGEVGIIRGELADTRTQLTAAQQATTDTRVRLEGQLTTTRGRVSELEGELQAARGQDTAETTEALSDARSSGFNTREGFRGSTEDGYS